MEEKDEEKQRPFTTGSVVDDMMDWARKLNALGDIIGAVALHERNCDLEQCTGGTQIFFDHGETIGTIVSDYARAIELALEENHRSWIGLERKIVFNIKRPQEVLDWLRKGGFHELTEISCIEYQLKELDAFCENAALPAMRLKNDFEDFKKQFVARQKKAPEAVKAAAGA